MLEGIGQLHKEIHILKEYNNIDTDELEKIADAIEREVDERYVEGPTDKNGDPITYDTMIEQWGVLDYIGCKMLPDGTCEWIVRGHDLSAPVLSADEVSIVKPPTVEDVLREFTDAILEWAKESGTVAEVGTWSDVAAEYVKRLKLREED